MITRNESYKGIISPFFLPFIILIEGFVSIATEILAIRQLLPFAGGSVIVTSIVIGIFLLFLALGYNQGGKIQNNVKLVLQRNFFIASSLLGIGMSYVFISNFFLYAHLILGPHVIYPLTLYLLLIIAPLIYLLGQTLPITMNMIKQSQSAGHIGSYTLTLSTIGSFLGSILTSLVTMHYFGVAFTVFFNSILLILLAFSLFDIKELRIKNIIIFLLPISLIYILNIYIESNVFVLTNSYANYQILAPTANDYTQQKLLIINEAYSSKVDNRLRGFTYIETIKKILFQDLKLRDQEILVLGAGGFSLSAESSFDNHITYVDIDPQIKKAAIPQFINKLNAEFVADDARHFLRVTNKKYAAIVIDVYTDYKAIPAHLVTAEYLSAVNNRLLSDGTAIINIVANPRFTDRYSKHLDNTIRAVFPNCLSMPQNYANQVTNIIYVCTNSGVKDNLIYTDNLNHSTTDSFNW